LHESQQLFLKSLYHAIHHSQKVARVVKHNEHGANALKQLTAYLKLMDDVILEITDVGISLSSLFLLH
jgi:hypothetical protein